jgi:hypothetical protein
MTDFVLHSAETAAERTIEKRSTLILTVRETELHESASAFYLHHEFTRLQGHPNKLFLAMATIEKAFKKR